MYIVKFIMTNIVKFIMTIIVKYIVKNFITNLAKYSLRPASSSIHTLMSL